MTRTTIAQALNEARRMGLARLDAHQLLAHLTGRPRTWLMAHDDEPLTTVEAEAYASLCRRRAEGEPLAHLTGEREFHGLRLQVTPAVLVPRPDTETLVDWALALLQPDGALGHIERPQVVDLGTGSGAIGLAVKQNCPHAEVLALDVSPAALLVARANADALNLPMNFGLSDWWTDAGAGPWHLALSNPPYIAEDDPHLPALRHEPLQALTPGGDGLAAIDRLITDAPGRLTSGGWLLLEHGHDQAAAVRKRLQARGFTDVSTRRDIEGRERCSGGRWPMFRSG